MEQTVTVKLTPEQWDFIVSGLRDLANQHQKEIESGKFQVDAACALELREGNLELAREIQFQVTGTVDVETM